MFAFAVEETNCGACAAAITRSIRQVDKAAVFEIDLADWRIEITGSVRDPASQGAALAAAGYTPVPLGTGPATASAKAGTGCSCCG